ncbi:MAG: zinc finger domain-containing protein [archaeon]|nr:DUF1610 domain-containing protein [Candidatus Micrarchaeota archaeon]
MKKCISCNKEVTRDFVEFKCPKCGKAGITRCFKCRSTSKVYKCPQCGFEGP